VGDQGLVVVTHPAPGTPEEAAFRLDLKLDAIALAEAHLHHDWDAALLLVRETACVACLACALAGLVVVLLDDTSAPSPEQGLAWLRDGLSWTTTN
jgi:hypothetical protein